MVVLPLYCLPTPQVCLENTTNKGGGAVYSLEAMSEISQLCREKGLALHLDGARLFNAVIASRNAPAPESSQTTSAQPEGAQGTAAASSTAAHSSHSQPLTPYGPKELGSLFDSISLCLSKGLGCPVGSILIGELGHRDEGRGELWS